jgi:hemolysin III
MAERTSRPRAAARGAETVVDAVVRVAKPRLRGWLHAAAAPLVLAAGIVLVVLAPTADTGWASAVYGLTGLVLFATSATYHLGRWSPAVERRLKRADHANIYLIIAGSYTPIAVTALEGWERATVLGAVWGGAALGVGFRLLWIDAPRWLSTVLYVVLGWSIAPFIGSLFGADVAAGVLVATGGVLYTVGAVVYATRRPDPAPAWFGFHEVFHAFTIAAWTCQYVAISLLVLG